MDTRYPAATWRPLGRQTEPLIGTPRVLVFHTMSGYLQGTDTMFREDGYTGTESHFGVGGPWDGPALDGAVWQWQSLDRQADAQAAGNAYATSIETSDGGPPSRPWSAKQVEALVALGAWWCRTTGNPAKVVTSPDDRGIGWHAQFSAWNPDAHACPGPVRLAQLRDVVVPGIARALGSPPAPATVLTRVLRLADPWQRGDDVRAVQARVGAPADGIFGPATDLAVRGVQRARGLAIDGAVGPATAAALGLTFKAAS